MNPLSHAKNIVKTTPLLRAVLYRPARYVIERTIRRRAYLEEKRQWVWRNREVLGCPDNDHIPRVPEAGRVVRGVQTMHNGLKIRAGSYYGSSVTRMLELNRGVHEPQEEWVFQEVIRHVRPGGVMLELGAYWGFYSMWFLSAGGGQTARRAILVEPDPENLKMGRDNFALNGLAGEFVQAFVGAAPATDRYGRRTVSVDELAAEHRLDRIDILHADIQGFETQMLEGARTCLARGIIDTIFISTHSQELHERCREILKHAGFEIIADADLANTYSYDGLIAARRAGVPGPAPMPISQKSVQGIRG